MEEFNEAPSATFYLSIYISGIYNNIMIIFMVIRFIPHLRIFARRSLVQIFINIIIYMIYLLFYIILCIKRMNMVG